MNIGVVLFAGLAVLLAVGCVCLVLLEDPDGPCD